MAAESLPTVSCIMPTANRAAFIPAAVTCFLGQDYAARELIVLDNGAAPIDHLLPSDPRIRYLRAPPGSKLGALRNAACEAATGEIIVHWDDDDWYPPDRISRQVACLMGSGADLCGSSQLYFIDAHGQRAWAYKAHGARPWLAGSSLTYWRRLWQRRPFDAIQVGEDTRFVMALARDRVVDLADPGLCVAAVHANNTSPKRPLGNEWRAVAVDEVLALQGATVQAPGIGTLMPRVCIGIHAHSDPVRLAATLRNLALHTSAEVQRLLLIDGPDAGLRAALAQYTHLSASVTDEPRGAPACFNRLLREADADVYVFLESGSLVGPGWLDHLLAALAADATHGLAGPSTNMAWSVQGDLRGRGARADNINEIARQLALRSAGQWQNLAPLHCLADFCYAVRRDVAQRIGGADEGYGQGPCWEMDYTVRAARAGFASVWARAAYVYRMPFTAQRQRDEARLMPESKAHYQRKFCGQMLDGSRSHVVDNCRGDQCPSFAPVQRIRLHHALRPEVAAGAAETVAAQVASPSPARPLVSCIMPTAGRLPWVLQSIRYFQRQDYPNLELVIVDDGTEDVSAHLPRDPRIRYVHRPKLGSIGAKRNLACEMAQGSYVAHWDDDDWYGASRLSAQLAPLLRGEADITALTGTPFFDVAEWQFWRCSPALYARIFRQAVHGGTLVYARSLFGAACRFPNISLAEDAAFLQASIRCGARLQAVASADHFVYVRHGRNAWRFGCGQLGDKAAWTPIELPDYLADDMPYYRQHRPVALHGT